MIARLRGKIANKGLERMILDVGGVGYDVQMSLHTYNTLPEDGEDAVVYIHSHIREDAFQLMGFSSLEEREIFRMLIAVSGVGPRMALNILSGIPPAELVDTLKRSNLARLTAVPGIGKRKAERLVVDLRDKMKELELGLAPREAEEANRAKERLEALSSALVNMGYKQSVVDKIVNQLKPDAEEGKELGELVKLGLQKLVLSR